MAIFQYNGRDKSGRRVEGRLDAKDDSEARLMLQLMGVTGVRMSGLGVPTGKEIKLPAFFRKLQDSRGVADSELVKFTKQLSVMIDAGVSVIKALEILESQSVNPVMQRAIAKVRGGVEKGLELGDSLESVPNVFDQFYCSLVRAGSSSGQLDVILRRLSQYIEKSVKLKRQLFGAMFYPSIVIGLAVVLTIFMLVFVVPALAKVFIDGGKELPGLTQAVIDASNFLQANYLNIIGVTAVVFYLFKRWIATPQGRYQWDSFLLRIPLVGTLILKICIARFASTSATLVSSGVNITEVLKTASKVLGNKILEEGIARILEGVIQGKGIGGPMAKEPFFPPMVSSMVSIGEASGRLDTMLEKVSDFYEEEVDVAMSALLKAIEPVMFVVIGGIVGVILIAMYLPVFDMASIGG